MQATGTVSRIRGAVNLDRAGAMFGALADNPHYRTYWLGNQVNTLMWPMQVVANGYLAYTLTNSATALGIVSLASAVPQLLFAPVGGVLADRLEKRKLLLTLQGIMCLTSLAIGILLVLDRIEFWNLVVVAIIQGMVFSAMMPTRQSWIPSLVSRDQLANAIALNNAGQNASRIIGPSLAGLLIAIPWFTVNGIYFLRVITFTWVLYTLLKIPIPGKPIQQERPTPLSRQLFSGLGYIWSHETLMPLFTFALVMMLLGQSYQQVMPAYALGIFDVGSEGLGLMLTVVGIGALTGSLTMAYISRRPDKARIQAYTGTALGLALAFFGLCSAFDLFGLSLVALFVVGLCLDFDSTINNTLIMINAEPAYYGRVMSVYMMTFALGPLGGFMAGWSIDHIGGAATMLGAGITLSVFVVCMATLNPRYKKIRNSIT
ncbi:MAG: MFS transporter [Chloroflexi bacterium]|nr:MFS transporter [Chloroflexota bacterium]